MALLINYSDANKVIQNEPVVQYRAEPTLYGKTNPIVAYWTLTRSSSGTHRYVGMTKAAALACAEALKADYTRKYAEWEAQVTDGDGSPIVTITPRYKFECAADISVDHAAGSAYEVSVTSNDTDIIITTEEPKSIADFEAIFQAALARDVPMTTLYLAVESAEWFSPSGRIKVNYTHKGSNFDTTKVGVEVKQSGGTWTAATIAATTTDTQVQFEANGNCTFRLTYDTCAAYSKEYTTHDDDAYSFVVGDCALTALQPYSQYGSSFDAVRLKGRVTISGGLGLGGAFMWLRMGNDCRYKIPFDGVTSTEYTTSCTQFGSQWEFDMTVKATRLKGVDVDSSDFGISFDTDYRQHNNTYAPIFTPTRTNYLKITDATFDSSDRTITTHIKTDVNISAEDLQSRIILQSNNGSALYDFTISSCYYESASSSFRIVAKPYETPNGIIYNGSVLASLATDYGMIYAVPRYCSGSIPLPTNYRAVIEMEIPYSLSTQQFAFGGNITGIVGSRFTFSLYKVETRTTTKVDEFTVTAGETPPTLEFATGGTYRLCIDATSQIGFGTNFCGENGAWVTKVTMPNGGNYWHNSFDTNSFKATSDLHARTFTIPCFQGDNGGTCFTDAVAAGSTNQSVFNLPDYQKTYVQSHNYFGAKYAVFHCVDGDVSVDVRA